MRARERFKDWLSLRPWQRHSLVLSVAGTFYAFIGLAYVVNGTQPTQVQNLRLALAIMPLDAWAVLWMVCGMMAIVSARWPTWSETWGYVALTLMASMWTGFYVAATLMNASTLPISGAVVWALIAFLWWAISGLKNPIPEPTPLTHHFNRPHEDET